MQYWFVNTFLYNSIDLWKIFYFGVYFRKIMGKIVYTSTLPDCLNGHV